MLTDLQIQSAVESGDLGIEPFHQEQVQPASYDVRLFEVLREPLPGGILDLRNVPEGHTREVKLDEDGYVLMPGAFILGCTEEIIRIGGEMTAKVEGKSSLGRLGLAVHVTAGFIDPGFEGQVTLEIVNQFTRPLRLFPGMKIGQLTFTGLSHPPQHLYGRKGNYMGQRGPVESRYSPS